MGCLTTRYGIAWEHVLVSLWGMGCTAAVVSEGVTRGASADSLGSVCCGNKLKSEKPAAPIQFGGKGLLILMHHQILPQTSPVAVLPMGAQ